VLQLIPQDAMFRARTSLTPMVVYLQRQALTLLATILFLLMAFSILPDALALEKYGRPLPSMEEPSEEERAAEETLFGGYFLTAAFVKNPTFAARPDNTGLVGLRHMLHLETDLYKQYLTFYMDQNFFSDRTKGWLQLSEWDGTYALTGLVDRSDGGFSTSGMRRLIKAARSRFMATC
jgi:hypothetical protein